jgi:hypothetical protein
LVDSDAEKRATRHGRPSPSFHCFGSRRVNLASK